MPREALDFLKTQRTCVFAVEMTDGSPHAATVHFAHIGEEPRFIFLTERKYRKFEPFAHKDTVRASVVLGTNETDMKTLQMDGSAKITEDNTLVSAYYERFTEKKRGNLDDNDVFLVFTPTWWRFTDWTLPKGKGIFTSS